MKIRDIKAIDAWNMIAKILQYGKEKSVKNSQNMLRI